MLIKHYDNNSDKQYCYLKNKIRFAIGVLCYKVKFDANI